MRCSLDDQLIFKINLSILKVKDDQRLLKDDQLFAKFLGWSSLIFNFDKTSRLNVLFNRIVRKFCDPKC